MGEFEALAKPVKGPEPILLANSQVNRAIYDTSDMPKPGRSSDRPTAPPEGDKDIVVKVSYNDNGDADKFDGPIKRTVKYNAIEITDLPKGVGISHWKDADGRYYFWFGDEKGDNVDGRKHYYPGNVNKIIVPGYKPQDVVAQRQKVDAAIERKRAESLDIKDGVFTLSIKDGDFDKKLAGAKPDRFDTLKITDLGTDKLQYGMDEKGFYFKAGDGKPHYYKENLKTITVDDQKTNMKQMCMATVRDFAADAGAPFKSLEATAKERQQKTVPQDRTVKYLLGLGEASTADALDVLDKRLTEIVNSNDKNDSFDPYFKTWSRWALAQVRVAEIVPTLVRNVQAHKPLNDPSVTDKFDRAIEILNTVNGDSENKLKDDKKFPSPNVPLMPFDPWEAMGVGGPEGRYMFWGGAYDQSDWLKLQLTLLRDALKSGFFQIPPERPE